MGDDEEADFVMWSSYDDERILERTEKRLPRKKRRDFPSRIDSVAVIVVTGGACVFALGRAFGLW